MISSNKKKSKVDEVSRETQRLVKDSHVHLPYHVAKPKSLKDFLNRPKISTENQVSLTGPKKLLRKAWEFIEIKEQNVEKFYNEISIQDEATEEPKSPSDDDIQTEENNSLVDLDDIDYNDEIHFDEEENCENSEISDCEEMSLSNDDDNSNESHNDKKLNSNKYVDMAKNFIDDEAEFTEYDCSGSDDGLSVDIHSSENEEEIEVSKKKKRQKIFLPDSTDDELDSVDDNDVIYPSVNETVMQIPEQETMYLDTEEKSERNLDTEIEIASNDLIPLSDESGKKIPTSLHCQKDGLDTVVPPTDMIYNLINEPDEGATIQELMDLCSGKFQTQPETQESVLEDNFDSSVPLDNYDEDSDNGENDENDENDENEMPKLTSVNDFFDDEAELSESDWSSDDENHEADKLDKLDEEAGDKDELDEKLVKDGLDKIYMRQLLDDDIKKVTELKERLLEDGELYSDTGRKRKFQWNDTDQNDDTFKKPLFSDSEDENETEVLNADDDFSGLWRKERYKREAYLSQTNDSEDEMLPDSGEKSVDIMQTPTLNVKKTRVIKYKINGPVQSELNVKSIAVSSITDSPGENTKNKNTDGLVVPCVAKISEQSTKFLKGSFMKRKDVVKLTTILNKYHNNDETDSGNCTNRTATRPLSTILAKSCNNPFASAVMDNKKQYNTNIIDKDINLMNAEKKDIVQLHKETKKIKTTNSILKHLK